MLVRRAVYMFTALVVLCMSFFSASAEQFSFPWVTPTATPSSVPTSEPKSYSSNSKSDTKDFGDGYMYFYAPKDLDFEFYFPSYIDPVSGDWIFGSDVSFTGKGSDVYSFRVRYSDISWSGIDVSGGCIIYPSFDLGVGAVVILTKAFGEALPCFNNSYYTFGGSTSASFAVRSEKFNNSVFYINVMSSAGELLTTSEPTIDPIETYRPDPDSVPEENVDLSAFKEVIDAVKEIVLVVWDLFPYFATIFIIILVVMFIKVVL